MARCVFRFSDPLDNNVFLTRDQHSETLAIAAEQDAPVAVSLAYASLLINPKIFLEVPLRRRVAPRVLGTLVALLDLSAPWLPRQSTGGGKKTTEHGRDYLLYFTLNYSNVLTIRRIYT
jgi:hypothetical protein